MGSDDMVKGYGSEVVWTSGFVSSMEWKRKRVYSCHEFEEFEY
jgi:hypothetical protein